MTSEHPPDAAGTVELTVPADPAYLALLRTVIASLAAGRDYTLDEIDDLRIAVDEAGALLLPHAAPDSRLSAVFGGAPDLLRAEVSVTMPAGHSAGPDRSSFAWLVLTALTDSTELTGSGRRLSLVLTKGRGSRDR
ncbi:anti-sigma factor [Jatrophihabitans sp.]|uniref:anti-sigma factor n=1 Tax=Jatrophihabitans sp. TaxID=1932789 RepID=UPI002D1578BE|nr:anti-sigma regulatory factor [Jatrophihabitans sp.]